MKITILCENSVGFKGYKTCSAEWGLSIFIEMKNNNILFDTGRADIYKNNAKNLGIDLEKADFVVLSHRHADHTGGIQFHNFKTKKKIIFHPELLEKLPKDGSGKRKKAQS